MSRRHAGLWLPHGPTADGVGQAPARATPVEALRGASDPLAADVLCAPRAGPLGCAGLHLGPTAYKQRTKLTGSRAN